MTSISQTHQLDFENTALAFQARSNDRLKRDYRLFKMIDSPFLTKVGPPLLTSSIKIGLPITGLVRKTIYSLFCGGESITETVSRSRLLNSFNVKTILDYSVEGEKTEAGFDATLNEILRCIKHGEGHEEVTMTACKMTALASSALLEKVQLGKELKDGERAAFTRIKQRMNDLARAAAQHKTPLYIDAEDSWIQDPIDAIAEDLMERYNKEKVIVSTTLQLYRHDRLQYLEGLIERSRRKGYLLAVKLVRGAYMEKERERAAEKGYPDPIQPNKEATDRDFDEALRLCIENIDQVTVCAGTHNEKSSKLLTELMAAKGLPNNHPGVWFSQLLGMSDHISFNLAHHGYNVAKYLPYGPVRAVMPYLMRRAEENTSVAGQASREMDLLSREMKRRGLR
jgi:proline dehydrogenase